MIKIPAGPAKLGGNCGGEPNLDTAPIRPEHTVDLPAFSIDKLLISRAEYKKCIAAGGCPEIPERLAKPSSVPPDNHPVLVTFKEAESYCKWAGKRLPTEDEWEKAARGTGGRVYPWGKVRTGKPRANFCDEKCGYPWRDPKINDGYHITSPVGAFPKGASPYGLLDMSGNVKQWVTPVGLELKPGERLARGSSWYTPAPQTRVCNRHLWHEGIRIDDKGFRCVKE